MNKLAIVVAFITLFIGSNAAACVVFQSAGSKSYLKNTCTYPVKMSLCKGNCQPQAPRATFPAGAKKLVVLASNQLVNYRWCETK